MARDIPRSPPFIRRKQRPQLPSQLAWLLVQSPEELNRSEAATLARIVQDAEVARVVGLARA
jgi:hypothetical protein